MSQDELDYCGFRTADATLRVAGYASHNDEGETIHPLPSPDSRFKLPTCDQVIIERASCSYSNWPKEER